MKLATLLSEIRKLNVDALAGVIASHPGAFVEPAYRREDGDLAVEGKFDLPCRADVITRIDGCPGETLMVDPERKLSFTPIEARISAIPLFVEPFGWDHAHFTARFSKRPAILPLRDWFLSWFDSDDTNASDKQGLYRVVHYLSDPKFARSTLSFTVDFGSAPSDAFKSLVKTLVTQGAQEVRVV